MQECLHWTWINSCIWLKTVLSEWCKCHEYKWGLILVFVLDEGKRKGKTSYFRVWAAWQLHSGRSHYSGSSIIFHNYGHFGFRLSLTWTTKISVCWGTVCKFLVIVMYLRWWMDNHIPNMMSCRFSVEFWAAESTTGSTSLPNGLLIVAVTAKSLNVAQGMDFFFFLITVRVEFKCQLNAS